jgi:hypothetical protein
MLQGGISVNLALGMNEKLHKKVGLLKKPKSINRRGRKDLTQRSQRFKNIIF